MKIWQYISSKDLAHPQSYNAGIQHDTLWFDSPYKLCRKGLTLPFSTGTINHTIDDSISAIEQDSLVVYAGIFDSVYQIYFRCWCGDECRFESKIWFAHNIGIIKIDVSSYNWPPPQYREERWELLNYHLISKQ